jgi:hypothetical protein
LIAKNTHDLKLTTSHVCGKQARLWPDREFDWW